MIKGIVRARALHVCALATACAVFAAAICELGAPSAAKAQARPLPPAAGQLGSEGPCGTESREATNAWYPTRKVYVQLPTGSAALPDGTCDDSHRPIVVIAHGLCLEGLFPVQYTPDLYKDLVRNLVSNGSIVVFPTYCTTFAEATQPALQGGVGYDTVAAGLVQALIDASLGVAGLFGGGRGNLANIGIFGHSYGAGMAPWLAETAWSAGWGSEALWIASYAPYVNLRGGHPFALPAHTRSLHVIYQHDQICPLLWLPLGLVGTSCNIRQWSQDIYDRIPVGAERKWSIKINSDCMGAASCYPSGAAQEFRFADHFTPGNSDFDGVRGTGHLKYFGNDRNLQVLRRCASDPTSASCNVGQAREQCTNDPTSASCNGDLTYMGTWTAPTFHATHASWCSSPAAPECSL